MVETGGLENRLRGNLHGGSNPSSSAIFSVTYGQCRHPSACGKQWFFQMDFQMAAPGNGDQRVRHIANVDEAGWHLNTIRRQALNCWTTALPIWRFVKMWTFARLIESGSLYFSRADLLGDEHEGLPLEDYVKHVVANMGPGHTFENSWKTLKEDRQGSFISCWTLDESLHMWEKFAAQGVAVKSTCGLLKAALDAIPARTIIGHVRYSLKHEGYNILRFITTKRPEYFREREVRALVWDLERCPQNPLPHDMPDGLSYPVDVLSWIQTVIVSPHVPPVVFGEVQDLLRKSGYGSIPVVRSGFAGYGHLLPTADEIARYSTK